MVRIANRSRLSARITFTSARRATRAKAAILEAAYRVEAAGIVMLVERQARGRAVGIPVTQARMHAQGVVLAHRHEQLAVVVELVEGQVAARSRAFEYQALRMTASCEHAAIESRLGPACRCLEIEEAVALLFHELEDLVHGITASIKIILLHSQAE